MFAIMVRCNIMIGKLWVDVILWLVSLKYILKTHEPYSPDLSVHSFCLPEKIFEKGLLL